MKLTFEIVAIWTALNFVVGIPVWMLVKLRDRREMIEQGIDWESFANGPGPEPASASLSPAASPVLPPRSVPLIVGAGSLVPGPGSGMLGAVHRVGADNRSISDL